jgi:adenylate cyclase
MIINRLKNIRIVALLAIAFVIGLYYLQTGLLEGFEDNTYDLRVNTLRTAARSRPNIAIVAIDEKTIAELGRYPFSRIHYTTLLDVTTRAGAKAVLFDIFFPEEQSKLIDGEFAAAIKRSGRVTLTGGFEFADDGRVVGLKSNIPVLQNAAKRITQINVMPDRDGVLRWTMLALRYQGKIYPSLGLSGAAELLGVETFEIGSQEISLGPRRIPVDSGQRMLVNYAGPPGLYERFSFVDVVKGRVAKELLKDRVLFVGATALGIYDMRITPFSNNVPGVEVNASIADNIATGDFIRRDAPETLMDLALIIFFGMITMLATWKLSHVVSLPLVLTLITVHIAFCCGMFKAGSWVSIVYPVVAILLTWAITAYIRFFIVDRQAREIQSMFSDYVSKKVVDVLVKNPEMARIGGESRELTILFADVQNYTSYSEKRSPAEVVRILNDYLAAMADMVIKYDGTLDKFLGDGVLAFWNAPLPQENHAELAVRCALEMMDSMEPLQKKWRSAGDEPLTWGIGINTGNVIVGNIGAVGKKMEYTAIGDNVNLTYRIQNESRDAHCAIITRSLYEKVKGIVNAEPLGSVTVKGKKIPIEVFALRGLRPPKCSD